MYLYLSLNERAVELRAISTSYFCDLRQNYSEHKQKISGLSCPKSQLSEAKTIIGIK